METRGCGLGRGREIWIPSGHRGQARGKKRATPNKTSAESRRVRVAQALP